MTKVVNCKKEPYDIYIGRPSIWGNPFSHLPNTLAQFKVSSRSESIDAYAKWILTQPHLMEQLHTLKDKILGCHCKPKPCHGDILVKMIEEITIDSIFTKK